MSNAPQHKNHTKTPPTSAPTQHKHQTDNNNYDPLDEYDGTLSVAMVAQRIGVSASTIRTWERRYGLSAAQPRDTGKHRRYTRADLRLLQKMAALVKSGIRASDAAQEINKPHTNTHASTHPNPININALVDAAHLCNLNDMEHAITTTINDYGPLHAWTQLIEPALNTLHTSQCACAPGADPTIFLKSAAFSALRAATPEILTHTAEHATILIITDDEHQLPAHICGAELTTEHTPVAVLDSENFRQGITPGINTQTIKTLLILTHTDTRAPLLEDALHTTAADIIALAPDMYGILHHRIQRLRTLDAAITEIRAAHKQNATAANRT